MNTIRQIERINDQELSRVAKLDGTKGSWHDDYKHSPYIYIGGLPFELNEGDILSIFSQYGTIIDVDLAREAPATSATPSPHAVNAGKSRGFAFVGYEDQRSTILAVDNFNGIKILGRTIRVDHCANYKGTKKTKRQGEDDNGPKSSRTPHRSPAGVEDDARHGPQERHHDRHLHKHHKADHDVAPSSLSQSLHHHRHDTKYREESRTQNTERRRMR